MVADGSDWPLPSQSHRVRLLLYLAEGLILGAGLTFVLLIFAGATLVAIESGVFNRDILAIEILALLFFLIVLLRGIAFGSVAWHTPLEHPPEYQDWTETRQWRWVIAVTLPIVGTFLGAVFLWEQWVLYGTLLAGFILYLYVLHRIGMAIS